jgi:hypothetical protein
LRCGAHRKREVESAAGVSISTVYRWVKSIRTARMSRDFLRIDGQLTRPALAHRFDATGLQEI